MAEFCLDCMNKYDVLGKDKLTKKDVVLADDFCEGCGEIKPCVVNIKRWSLHKL